MTWGGSHDLIVALDADGLLVPELWPLVELFDADIWAKFITTRRHLELIGEGVFERWLEVHLRMLAERNGVGIEVVKRSSADFEMNDPLDGGGLSEALVSDICRRTGLATEFRSGPQVQGYFADHPPERRAINVLDLGPLPGRVLVPVVDHFSVEIQLIAAMRWGALSPSAQRRLKEERCPVVHVRVEAGDLDRLLTAAWFGPGVQWWVKSAN